MSVVQSRDVTRCGAVAPGTSRPARVTNGPAAFPQRTAKSDPQPERSPVRRQFQAGRRRVPDTVVSLPKYTLGNRLS